MTLKLQWSEDDKTRLLRETEEQSNKVRLELKFSFKAHLCCSLWGRQCHTRSSLPVRTFLVFYHWFRLSLVTAVLNTAPDLVGGIAALLERRSATCPVTFVLVR